MPDITSHYFLLQKNSKKVNAASGGNLAVVADANAASKYIYESYSNGKQYNFTPRFTNKTTVTVGGGNGGGISFATVKKGPEKQFGDVYGAVKDGRIVSKVFNLDKCSENPYAIYTNVGTWYDYGSKRTYAIDMKMTVTGYKFPGAAVRKQLANKDLKAPYVGFGKSKIGITVMGTDHLQTRLEFYYSGTTTAVAGIKGMIQFCDIDAQQGVDFGNGFEKIVMFNTSQSKLQYNKNGLIAGSKGYVSSRISTDLNSNNEHTTAMGIFSGSSVNCRWTVAKCDQKDTGGDAAYGVKGGYGIPAESTLENSNSYYWSNSTGFLGVRADVGIAPLPEEVIKSVYIGNVNGQNSEKGSRFAGLSERNQVFTYVLSAVAPTPSNVKNAQYTMFQIEDRVDALLNVKSVKVYADEAVSNNFQTMGINYSDMTSYFHIIKREEADHSTTVQVKAVDERLGKAAFYGRTYYIHIEVEVKSDQELHAIHRSIAEWYQENETLKQKVPEAGSCKGSVAVSNNGTLYVKNDKGSTVERKSNDVASKIAMKLRVKKLDEESGKPVKGVVFGLFGGSDKNLAKEPLYTATTDDNGVALFTSMPSYTFYKEPFGNGPYYIKEISIYEITDFPNHPFKVKMDDKMLETIDSVRDHGVLVPALVREKPTGGYEMISGHRRKMASELAGKETMPCIVRNLSDDQAVIVMVDSNLQREEILPSEKAFAYKMKLDAMKRQGQRRDLTSVPLAQKFKGKTSREILGEQVGESQDQIRRYIRLTELIPEILEMVDDKKISMRPAVELSYLPKEEQEILYDTMESEACTPSHAQAIKIRKFSAEGRLNEDVLLSIMSEEKPNQVEQWKIPKNRLEKYFPSGTTQQKMEETIIKALELYRKREKSRER